MSHRTTRHGASAGSPHGPWLVSMVMWSNCMRFVTEKGIPVRELEVLARTTTNLPGMQRCGYVVVEPDPSDRRSNPPRSSRLVRATAAGREAQRVWQPLFEGIERRWQDRFGNDAVEYLRESLRELVASSRRNCRIVFRFWGTGSSVEDRNVRWQRSGTEMSPVY